MSKLSKPIKAFEDWSPIFLAALKKKPNIAAACRAAEISRRTYYNYRERDEDFAKAAADAEEDGVDYLEEKLWNKAMAGNIAALIYLLKARRFGDTETLNKKKRPDKLSVGWEE